MSDSTLLERVRQWEIKPGKRVREDSGRLVESVISHLQSLLNSRKGTTLMDEEFGMPDFTDLTVTFPDSIRDIERLIRETIEKYEPRLKRVDVDYAFQDDKDLTLFFQISAMLESGSEDLNVFLESTIDASGKMKVGR